MQAGTKVIFQGVKFYWRTRNTIDVAIVEHDQHKTTEVILFDPSLGTEAPRIYFSTTVLFSMIDEDDIELQLSFAKRNSVPITEKFVDGIISKAMSEFILNRLVITEYSAELKKVVVSFQLGGIDTVIPGLICGKPEELDPFKTVQYRSLMAGVVDTAIAALEVEKAQLFTECDKAQELEQIAECSTKPLTRRERWRIPIVFIKVSNSKRLSAPDAKIWTTVTQNMRNEEDAVRMSSVLTLPRGLRSTSTSASPSGVPTAAPSRAPSFSGSHHVITPCATPRHHSTSQSKLHQATVATRHRTEATQSGAHAHSLSRQNSYRQSSSRQSSFRGENNNNPAHADAEGKSKEVTTVVSPTSKRRLSKSPKRSTPSRGKKGRRSMISRLRRSLNLSTIGTAAHGSQQQGGGEGSDGDRQVVAGDTTTATVTTGADADCNSDSGDFENENGRSALQLMIASLAALNTSLRASFGGALSSKYGGSSGKSQQSGTTQSGHSAGASTAIDSFLNAPRATHTAESVALTTTADGDLDKAIQQATAGAALVPVMEHVPRQNSKNTSTKLEDVCDSMVISQKPQKKRSLLAALMSRGANNGGTSITPPTSKVSSSKYPVHSSVSDQQSAFVSMQKFFSDLSNWRSTSKIYVESARE